MRTSMEKRLRRVRAGFTLIELMIVVCILSILAAVSYASLSSYVYKSKAVEATGFLNEIKARQESYRADFGQYCDVSGAQMTVNPPLPIPSGGRAWVVTNPWTQLGAVPPGRWSRFAYSTVANIPGTVPGPQMADGSNRGYTGNDFWFISTAIGDLDGDGVTVMYESYSHSKAIWTSNTSGWE
jgi:prepilin-type N-terminal cleavage/methylation domain-containing protein